MNWIDYDKGSTINTIGSESGKIITDIEHISGARITIEKGGTIAPYSLTLGIYGLMFHTEFAKTPEEINTYASFAKLKIEEIFLLHEVAEENRDEQWNNQLSRLLDELTNW